MLRTVFFPALLLFVMQAYLITPTAHSLNTNTPYGKAREILREKSEVYLSFPVKNLAKANDVLQLISVDKVQDDRMYIYANAHALDALQMHQYDIRLEISPGEVDFDLNMQTWEDVQQKSLTDSWDFYPTYEAYENLMYQFAEDFPELCQVLNIVTLPSDRSILFAKITAVSESEPRPRFMYTSTMHGDETAGFILSLRLIHHLLTQYGECDDITDLLENTEIWISPNENPDGTYTNNNNTVHGATRSNANGIDLNRNYPNPVNDPSSAIQPETQAMMDLTDSLQFVMSANMHGGIECVNFPWDSWTSSNQTHADHDWWLLVSHEYADTARYYSPPGYMNPGGSSFNNGVTHGGDWYVVHGSRQDYMNYYAGLREFTLELSNTKLLPPEQLPAHWDYNHRSLLNYIRQVHFGFSGTITDMYSGEPLQAKVEVYNHDHDFSFVYSQLPFGDFYRPIMAGTYTLQFTKEGYDTLLLENLTISNYQNIVLEILMTGENPFAPPADLVAYTGSDQTTYLNWEKPSDQQGTGSYVFYQPEGYKVYRNGELINQVTELHYFDLEVPFGTHEYYVKAYYQEPQGLSHPSNTVSVTYYEPVPFTINASSGPNGSIDPEGEVEVIQGKHKTFVFNPMPGYTVDSVMVDGKAMGPRNYYTFVTVQENHSIHVQFTPVAQEDTFVLLFDIKDTQGEPIADASVSLNNYTFDPGFYVFHNLLAGPYDYIVVHENYFDKEGTVNIHNENVLQEVVMVSSATGVDQAGSQASLRLYPNPVSEKLVVESDSTIEQIAIYDLSSGKLMSFTPHSLSHTILVHTLQPGMYIVEVQTSSGVLSGKINVVR